jgi:uncharacterized membrane protein YqjE
MGFRRYDPVAEGFRDARGPVSRVKEEAESVGVLLRRLGDDLVGLIQDEIELAKVEIRREMRGIGADLGKIALAAGLALLAAHALTAFLIIGLGLLIGSFWGSALIVGVLYLIVAGVLAKTAASNLQDRNPVPEATVETLQEDARWAQREVQEFKRELKK